MINDILDYSQINHGVLRMNIENLNIIDLIHEVSKLIKYQAKKKGLYFHLENNLPVGQSKYKFLKSDQGRLKQILLNLLGNALKFTEAGHIKIIVNSKMNINRKNFIEIRVEDTGCGIHKDDIPKLFQLFSKLHNKDSKRVNKSGVGLGLAISQSLLQILNKNQPSGSIKVESELGKGSTFYFGIFSQGDIESDNEYDENSDTVQLPSSEYIKSRQMSVQTTNITAKILVVDDDQINLIVASKYLSKIRGISFQLANNGKEAIQKIDDATKKKEYFDIILMDCNMPFMDGFEATALIKQMVDNLEIPAVSIVACTANSSEQDYAKCFQAGMVGYLSKPIMGKDLKDMIVNILNKNRQEQF